MSMPSLRRRHHHHSDETREHEKPPAKTLEQSRHHSQGPSSRTLATFCVVLALLAFGIALVTEYISYTSHKPDNVFLNSFACLFSLCALGTGGYAKKLQAHAWSRRARNRLRIGMPIAALTLAVAIVNFYNKLPSAGKVPEGAISSSISLAPESEDMFGPGWYGEGQANGIEAVVVSFAENAPESRAFNRLMNRRVSYATMTVVNRSRPQPVILQCAQVGLVLASGEEIPSLAAKPLLRIADANESVIQHLSETRMLPSGAMAPDIPVCADADFRWERVRAVRLVFDGFVMLVPGRMMTADEKFSVLTKSDAGGTKPAVSQPAKAPAAQPAKSADAWLKDL